MIYIEKNICYHLRCFQLLYTQRHFFQNFVDSNQIWIVITLFREDFAPNGFPFNANSIGKVKLQSKSGLGYQDSKKISLCVQDIFRQECLSKI